MTLNEWIVKAEDSRLKFIKKYDKGEAPIDNITHLSLKFVKKIIPELMQEGKFDEAISIVLSEPIKETLKRKELDRFRILIWIEKQYENINLMEKKYLERQPDFKLISAGIKNLNQLGIINTVDVLAGGDVTKWEEIENLPYSKCFEKQLKNVIESDINKKLVELSKNERKK